MARILFVNHTERLGGPAKSLLMLHKYLKNHDVTIAVPREGTFTDILEKKEIPWLAFPFRFRHIHHLVRLIQRENFDLVYGNNYSNPAYKTLIATKLLGKPFVWHIREILPPDLSRLRAHRLLFADEVIAVSKSSSRSIQYHLPKKKVHVIYNGIETDDFSIKRDDARHFVCDTLKISDDHVIIVSVGDLCPRKNQMESIEVAAKVVKEFPFVVFAFLGRLDLSPQYTNSIKVRAKQLGITDNVRFLGFQNEIVQHLCGSDILLHMSMRDPHPRSVLEGMAAKLPVVAYDVDGVSETVVTGESGYLVPINDTETLAQRVGKLVTNSALREVMGKSGQRRVENMFTAQKTATQVDIVIKQTIEGKA